MKILVVDDKEENRYLVETLFKGSGYEVVTVANGREALVILHAEKIDLIISDCLMPVMDGFELCRQCKADETLKNIPFVFCTASYVDKKDEEFGLELGAAEYVIKPFEPEGFIKTIEGVIERAKEGKITKIKPALEDNALFQMYNERLLNKLSQKVSELYTENERCNQIEKELRISETNFRNSIDNSPLGIHIISEDGETSYTNQAFLDIYGYKATEEFKTTPVKERYTPESYLEFHERRKKRLHREPLPDTYEVSIIRKDGAVRQAQVIRKEIIWGGKQQYQTIYQDITERNQAAAALKNNKEFLNNVIEKTPNALWVSDEKGTIIRMNQALRDLLRIKDEEIIGKYNVLKDVQVIEQGYLPLIKSVFEEGKTVGFTLDYSTAKEKQVTLREPTHKVLEIVISAVRDQKGKVINAIAQESDITERQQMITRINELNDILQLISNINQLIVQIDNESELLQKACREFVGNRQFLLAWIGFKQESSYDIKPAAWAGEGADYLSSVKITWDESEFGQGPTGTAIKTGKPSVMRDIPHDPGFKPWRDHALQLGFISSVALPLVVQGKVIGVLGIYSGSTAAFNEKELELLIELGGDLSLGIEKIRNREDRRRMEETLRDSEHRLREAQEMSHLGFWNWDVKTGDVKWSEEVFKIFHLDPETFTPHIDSILALSPWPEDHQRDQELFNRAVESHGPGSYEQKFLRPDGSIGYYYSSFQGKYDANNNLVSIVGTVLDITERKRAEESLKAMTVRQGELLAAIPDIVMEVDINKIYVWANQAGLDFFGDDVVGKEAAFYFEGEQDTYAAVQPLFNGEGRTFYIESWQRRKDGQKRLLAWWCRVLKDKQGNVRGALSSAQDITEPRQLQEVIIASEVRYRRLFESAKDGILIIDANTGLIIDANPFLNDLLCLSLKEIKGKKLWEIGTFSDIISSKMRFQELQQKGYVRYEDLPLKTTDGRQISVEFVSNVYDVDHQKVIQCNIRDITVHKRAEEALKESEEKYRLIVEKSNDIIFTFNPAGEFLYISPSVKNMLGYNPADLIGRTFGSIVHPDDLPGLQQAIQQNIKDGSQTPGGNRYRIRHASGEWRWHNAAGNAVLDANGKFLSFVGIARDITEHKQAEEALQASENSFRNSLDNSPMGIHIVDNDWHTLYANRAFLDIYGYENIEELKASRQEDRYTPESYASWVLRHEKMVRGESVPDEIEADIVRKDGKIRHVQSFRKEVFWNGKQQYQLIYNDITERKQAEEALQESETRYHELVNTITSGVIIYRAVDNGEDFVFVDVNSAAEKMEGINRKDIIGKKITEVLPGSKDFNLFKIFQKVWQTGNSEYYSSNFYKDESDPGIWRDNWAYKLPSGEIVNVYDDITERKRAEEALKESEERYRLIVENTQDLILTENSAGEIIYITPAIRNILGYNQADIIGHSFRSLIHPEDRVALEKAIQRNIKDGYQNPGGSEFRVRRASGEWRWYNGRATVVRDIDGNFISLVAIAYDITERKLAEEELKASEQNFHNSLDSSLMGIRIVDEEWNTLYANQALLDIFGYKNINEVGRTALQDHYTPEEYARYILRKEKRLRGEVVPDDMKVDVVGKDGEIRHLEVFSGGVFWGGKQRRQIIYNDITKRQQAEEALKASEAKYSTLIEQSADGIVILDVHTIKFANRRINEVSGFSQDEILDKMFIDLVAPESKEITAQSYYRELSTGTPNILELEMLTKDGRRIPVDTRTLPIIYQGKPATMVTIRDITKRKQAEEALRASEQNFRNSLDSSLMGIRISDTDGHTLYGNRAFLDIFGYENIEEARRSPPHEHYTPEENARFQVRRERQLRGEPNLAQFEIDIVRKDGVVRHIQVFTKGVLWNDKQQREAIYNDITERKNMEEALRESEEKYRLIVENTRDIIFTVNAREEYVYVSPSVKGILGYNQADLIGKPFLSFVHPEDRHIIKEETELATVPGYHVSGDNEYRIRHASGEWRWVVSRGTRVMDLSGKIIYFTGVIRDITESKQAEKEKQILEQKAQVASRLAAVGEMAAGIAHEINNPLTGVLGFSQMLLENTNVPEDIKENIALIADGSQRMAEIVKRLLTFARQAKPVKSVANLNELIDNTLKLREYVLKTNSINVITRFDTELPWSMVDPGQMQQVFLNLIVNAEQAMKKSHGKGTLTITTEKKENDIYISFQDDGPGITRENMGHLFEPFFTTKAPGEGTGLGLSLSRSIILEHNGKMSVESEFGHGATFIVELPIVEALPSEVETTTPIVKEEKTITKQGRILVVDDEAGVRTLLAKTLTRAGHSVDVIDDARAALDIINAGTVYDVIVSDVRMPGMSGIELYPLIIRKMPLMKNRIIFITGDVMGLDIKTFLNQNNLSYLAKPFDLKLLKEKINTILEAGQN